MSDALNPWVTIVSKRAERLLEDADRVSFAAPKFMALIGTVASRITAMATRAPEPKVRRTEDADSVRLLLEWQDEASGWWLQFGVARRRGEKPRVTLGFHSADKDYSQNKPTQAELDQALYDYFEAWRREDSGPTARQTDRRP